MVSKLVGNFPIRPGPVSRHDANRPVLFILHPSSFILRHRRAGFTLLEVLVVLVIMAIVVGFVTLAMGPGENKVGTEARRFAQLVQLARDQAILSTSEYAVEFEPDGYAFAHWVEEKWEKIEDDEVLRPRQLPEEVEMEVLLEGEEAELPAFADDQALADRQPPRLYILSSGEFSPFVLTFRNRLARTAMLVRGTLAEGITVSVTEAE